MISQEQWEKIEQELKGSFCSVKLSLDGKEIHLSKEIIAENKLGIIVYIDGVYNLAWGQVDSEKHNPLVTQVWKQRSRSVYPPKEQKELIKIFGKRKANKHYDFSKKIVWYEPLFEKFGPLKRQYKKLEALEVLQIGHVITK
ncbi:hypothetical protein [Neptuniibacter marinus]|uniref:hypothetical protein n=1 Tax=Neptuniibacter marinus TaxID=1806670 RepID=UPI003B5BFCFF